MAVNSLLYKSVKPNQDLTDLVDSFWMLHNPIDQEQDVIILPDGRIDIFFTISAITPFHALLRGLDSEPGQSKISPSTTTFAISLTLLAAEYLLTQSVAPVLNKGLVLPPNFWGINAKNLADFDSFCALISDQIRSVRQEPVDARKQKLVALLYATHGSLSVEELAQTVGWSSRQINRYFTQWFGLSLKAYCNILRFRASFATSKKANYFPNKTSPIKPILFTK